MLPWDDERALRRLMADLEGSAWLPAAESDGGHAYAHLCRQRRHEPDDRPADPFVSGPRIVRREQPHPRDAQASHMAAVHEKSPPPSPWPLRGSKYS